MSKSKTISVHLRINKKFYPELHDYLTNSLRNDETPVSAIRNLAAQAVTLNKLLATTPLQGLVSERLFSEKVQISNPPIRTFSETEVDKGSKSETPNNEPLSAQKREKTEGNAEEKSSNTDSSIRTFSNPAGNTMVSRLIARGLKP